jgi:hypothetical protein
MLKLCLKNRVRKKDPKRSRLDSPPHQRTYEALEGERPMNCQAPKPKTKKKKGNYSNKRLIALSYDNGI